ncbi:MAG: BlaI/MecI/CopY family transcriptional regulator, partial [Capsulimonadaceae bacterium]
MARSSIKLGQVQLQIMQVLWNRGTARAREITDELNRTQAIAHSTVQTLLRQMEAKEAVDHNVDDHVFVYRPLISQADITERATSDLVHRIFGGSALSLVSHLLKTERIGGDELARLRSMIDEYDS